ncbi:hypothetical protein [Lentzea sp. NPDC004782]|uniref:hypothetical protein n=1 Tax=Lentzea sp. NPDC004782 TaxID=3154458 RepID=UPI0033AB78A4
MTEHVVVEWGDKSGGGFVPYTDPRRGAPPPRAFVKVAHDLQDDVVHQPPDDARDNDRFPVWGLQQVEVEDHGPQWCFTVQGRGGAFGRAGSCQFLFAPAADNPAEVWAYGAKLVGVDGRLGLAARPVTLPPVAAESLVGPLTALAQRRRRIALTGDPTEVASVILHLISALPDAVVAEHIWMTFPLNIPILDQRPSVTGQWPAEQSDNLNARQVARWLEPDPAEEPEPLPPRADEAIRWLARTVTTRRLDAGYRAHPSVRVLLETIIASELDITEADIGRLVHAHDRRLRDGLNPDLVRRWAGQQPNAAISELLRLPPSWLEDELLEGLLEAQRHAEPGQNPAKFPPANATRGWHERLANLLRARCPERDGLLQFVREHVTAPGKPLGTPELVLQHRVWLEHLGVPPGDPSVFGVPVKEIASALARSGRISAAHRDTLRAAPDQIGALKKVVQRMPEVTADHAAVLMTVPDEEDGMRQVLEIVLEHNRHRDERAATWLAEVVQRATSGRVKRAVVTAGVGHLGRFQAGPLPAAFLSCVLQHWSDGEDDPASARLLRDAASRLKPPAPAITTTHRSDAVSQHDVAWPPVWIEPERVPAATTEPETEDAEAPASPWTVVLFTVAAAVVVLLPVIFLLSRLGQ